VPDQVVHRDRRTTGEQLIEDEAECVGGDVLASVVPHAMPGRGNDAVKQEYGNGIVS
jgi:hypothetical protein